MPLKSLAAPSPVSRGSGRSLLGGGVRLLRLVRRVLGVVLGAVVVLWSLLLLAWVGLNGWILPHIQQWREPIEVHASRALGVPVRIGQITVHGSGWMPTLELRDVILLDAEQRAALQLPRVVAVLSPRSLLALELRFEQLLIDGAALDVRRDAAGRIFVAGIDFGAAGGASNGSAADWFFKQREVVIRGAALRWSDAHHAGAALQLDAVQLVFRNSLRHHDMRLDATPPPEWGDRFTAVARFTQPLLAQRGDWRHWSGRAHLSLPRVDLHALRQHATLPFDLSEGVGGLRGWFEIANGAPTAATVDLALRAVTLRLARHVEPLRVEELEGRLTAQRNADGVTLAVQRFTFLTGDDIRWPQGDMTLRWRQRDGQPATGAEFSAERLDLAQMAQVAARVPLGDALQRLLAELKPRGVVSDLSARWDGPLDAPLHYRASARIDALSFAARPSADPRGVGRPGLRNAHVQLDATEVGGQARIAMHGGGLDLPGVFDESQVPLDQLDAQLSWRIEPVPIVPGVAGDAGVAAALPKLTVQVKDARFSNVDTKGELNATWSTGAGPGAALARDARLPGRLMLDARLRDAPVARVHRYLPRGMGQDTRDYIAHAALGGRVPNARFQVNGDLWDFPYFSRAPQSTQSAKGDKPGKTGKPDTSGGAAIGPHPAGEFRIQAQIEDATYAFIPDPVASAAMSSAAPARLSWPVLTHASAELNLERGVLEIRNGRAQLGKLDVRGVQLAVRQLDGDAQLTLDASAHGALAEMLQFVHTTPVGGWLGGALADSRGSGSADLKLSLNVPLLRASASTVKGSVTLPGNDLRITPDSPLLGATRGRVDFTQRGFSVVGATARLLGGDATFDGASLADGSVRFSGQGVASADGLRRASELGVVARFAGALSGQANYRTTLGFLRGGAEINVTSNLVGMAVNLPAPLNKAAETALALRYQTQLEATPAAAPTATPAATPTATSTTGATLHDTLRVELGTLVQAQYQRDVSGPVARVLRGGVGVMEAAPQPASGVAAHVTLKALAAHDWEAASERLFGGVTGGVAGAAALPVPGDAADPGATTASTASTATTSASALSYLPNVIALRVQDLTLGAQRLTHVVAGVSQDAGVWRANVDADQLNGYVEYRPAARRAASGGAGRVYARLARLALPKGDAEQVESLLDRQPASLPALDIVVDDFELRGKRLGRVEIEAVNRLGGTAAGLLQGAAQRHWQLAKFNITTPEAQFTATGNWGVGAGVGAVGGAPRRAVLDFKLALADSGALLDRLGTPQVVRGGKGQLAGQIGWVGSPFALDYPSLSGQIHVAIDAGQFLKAEPGAARLLSVLSLQSLPRRLGLDFRDVFQAGFAFDNVTGDLTIAQGVAQTRNLRMRGAQATVLMEGSADIARETQDLRVVVVPEINAGTAALAYAVINPAVGLGAFVAQVLLRKPLMAAGTREFHVSGSWADPQVKPVQRQASDAAAATGAASAPDPETRSRNPIPEPDPSPRPE